MTATKFKNSSMLLLWAGASISIAEIYTGGLYAPLGLAKGLAAIIIGHIIGTFLLALGGYISFTDKRNAMEKVRDILGVQGVKVIAFLNVLQLIGWGAVMIIQGGRAFSGVAGLPLNWGILIVALAVFLWAYFFDSYAKHINDIFVLVLIALSALIFLKIDFSSFAPLSGELNFATAIELSIVMPVSFLPLIGDYTKFGQSGKGVFLSSFFGYFIGSCVMYTLGLLISLHTGMDIIDFIVTSSFGLVAGLIIIGSTVTTAFLDIYSAVISTKQILPIKGEKGLITIFSLLATIIAFVFPIEGYQSFLIMIGSVFIPVYTVVFVEYFFGQRTQGGELNTLGLTIAALGTIIYNYFEKLGSGIPTLQVVLLVGIGYFIVSRLALKKNSLTQ